MSPPAHHLPDPYAGYPIRVRWGGRTVAGASAISTLGRSTQAGARHGRVTLERGVTHDLEFARWLREARAAPPPGMCSDLTIEIYAESGQRSAAYHASRCWAAEYQALAELSADSSALVIQHLTLESEGWERDGPDGVGERC